MDDRIQLGFKSGSFIRRPTVAILLILPILLCIYFIYSFAVEVVVYDEWKFIALAETLKNNPFSPDLPRLQTHVDHILLFTQLVMLAIGWLSKFNFITDMWGSVFVLLCINILLLKLGWKYFRGYKKSYLALIPLPWIMCSLRQWDNLLMGYQICMFLVSLFYLLSVIFLSITKSVNRNFVTAAVCAFIATISFGAGLLAWPLGFIQLFLQNYFRRQASISVSTPNKGFFYYQKTVILWLLISIFVFIFYKVNYHSNGAASALNEVLRSSWTAIPAYFLTSLGNPFAADTVANKVFAVATLFLFVWVIYLLKNEKNSIKHKFVAPLMLMLFGISYCVLLSLGRVTMMPATISRYATIPILGFTGLYIAIVGGYLKLGKKFQLPLGSVLTLLTLLIAIGIPLGLANGEPVRSERLMLLQIAQNYKLQNDKTLEILLPRNRLIKMAVAAVETNHWSYFAHKPLSLADLSEIAAPESNPGQQHCALGSINGHPLTSNTTIVVDSAKEAGFKFDGWAVRAKTKALEGGAFVIVDNKYVIPAAYGIIRPDVAKYLNRPNSACCGYWGICRSDLFAKGKHSLSLAIVDRDKKHYYRLADVCNFQII